MKRFSVESDRSLRHGCDIHAIDPQQAFGLLMQPGQIERIDDIGLIAIGVIEIEEGTARVEDDVVGDRHIQNRARRQPRQEHLVQDGIGKFPAGCSAEERLPVISQHPFGILRSERLQRPHLICRERRHRFAGQHIAKRVCHIAHADRLSAVDRRHTEPDTCGSCSAARQRRIAA